MSTGSRKTQVVAQESLNPGLRTPTFPLPTALNKQVGWGSSTCLTSGHVLGFPAHQPLTLIALCFLYWPLSWPALGDQTPPPWKWSPGN